MHQRPNTTTGATCPRRLSDFGPWEHKEGLDGWDTLDLSCTFCGSLHPDFFMQRCEAGDAELGPTDKNYKVYILNTTGTPFKQTSRSDDGSDPNPEKWVYETRETSQTKFYFQHLSDDQMNRFIELVNQKKVKLGYPGYFYRMPFFMQVIGYRDQ